MIPPPTAANIPSLSPTANIAGPPTQVAMKTAPIDRGYDFYIAHRTFPFFPATGRAARFSSPPSFFSFGTSALKEAGSVAIVCSV